MIQLFLTSSPFTLPGKPLNESNRFSERLSSCAKTNRKALMITSNPNDTEFTEGFSGAVRYTMELSGISFDDYSILDGRNKAKAKRLVQESDFLILAGGHVPTQNAFFTEIGLRELLRVFSGTVFGISAGSMNCADVVYAQPEAEGEAADPNFVKYLSGLGLTKTILIPHNNDIKDNILDGKKLFEEVTYPDSIGREFIAICDGSYLYSDGVTERICGEAYLISNGKIKKLCGNGEEITIDMLQGEI